MKNPATVLLSVRQRYQEFINSRPQSQRRRWTCLTGCGCGCMSLILLGLLVNIITAIGMTTGVIDPTATPLPTATYTPRPASTATPLPTSTPLPDPTGTAEAEIAEQVAATQRAEAVAQQSTDPDYLRNELEDALGSGNRDIARVSEVEVFDASGGGKVIKIRWAINDNLTTGMIAGSAQLDATEILKIIAEEGPSDLAEVQLFGTFSMINQLGNESESEVIQATYSGDTIRAINFENFLRTNVWAIADTARVHPEFQ